MTQQQAGNVDDLVAIFAASQPVQHKSAGDVTTVSPASGDHISSEPSSRSASADGPSDGGRWIARAGHFFGALSWVGAGLVAAVVIAIAAAIIVPRAMGWQGMIVLSGSMEPALPVGGMAFMEPIAPADAAKIERGDILTFRQERLPALISHRVVDIIQTENGTAFITRGDANAADDGTPVPAERIVGVVRYDVPHMGTAVQKLQDRTTYYIFLGIPAGLLIASELWSVGKEVLRARRESLSTDGARS